MTTRVACEALQYQEQLPPPRLDQGSNGNNSSGQSAPGMMGMGGPTRRPPSPYCDFFFCFNFKNTNNVSMNRTTVRPTPNSTPTTTTQMTPGRQGRHHCNDPPQHHAGEGQWQDQQEEPKQDSHDNLGGMWWGMLMAAWALWDNLKGVNRDVATKQRGYDRHLVTGGSSLAMSDICSTFLCCFQLFNDILFNHFLLTELIKGLLWFETCKRAFKDTY